MDKTVKSRLCIAKQLAYLFIRVIKKRTLKGLGLKNTINMSCGFMCEHV